MAEAALDGGAFAVTAAFFAAAVFTADFSADVVFAPDVFAINVFAIDAFATPGFLDASCFLDAADCLGSPIGFVADPLDLDAFAADVFAANAFTDTMSLFEKRSLGKKGQSKENPPLYWIRSWTV